MNRVLRSMGIFVLIVASIVFAACSKKTQKGIADSLDIKEINTNFTWYAFTLDSFIKINKIANAPTVIQKPWTEATRIASVALQLPTSAGVPKAFATVNRLGILMLDDDRASLYADVNLFSTRTAVGLVFFDNTPIFSMYKSVFFNDTYGIDSDAGSFVAVSKKAVENYKANQFKDTDPNSNIYDYTQYSNNPFLVKFDLEQKICFPIINTNNILLDDPNSRETSKYEVTDFNYDGTNFICSAKKVNDDRNRVNFSYFSLQPKANLLTITPQTAASSTSITKISQADFRHAFDYADFNTSPERLRDLLSTLPNTQSFTVELYTAGGTSPRRYVAGPSASYASFGANALICDTFIAAMFLDGTLFFKGSLYNGHTLNRGKTIAVRLPKLPAGFVYSNFTITGNTLYAAWEENYFYKSAKSGFIKVDLAAALQS